MIDIFDNIKLDLTNIVCHSGGAIGADSQFELIGVDFGVKTKAYSWKTKSHQSPNKVEISESDYLEGVNEVTKANKILSRWGIHKYMNLLARNWAQVKYSDQIIAIGRVLKTGDRGNRGYVNRGKMDVVDGGTGYAVMMGINNGKEVYVFDQVKDQWFRWSYTSNSFVHSDRPSIKYQNFAGIGTREITDRGIEEIREVYKKTFGK
jgi:hypothetical protein